MDRAELARRIHAAAHLTGTFTLRSGVVSNEYFDKYRFESDPDLLWKISEAMAPLVPAGIDALAGLELGGVPLATMLSQVTRPARAASCARRPRRTAPASSRKAARSTGDALCIVEDVVTSGGAVLDAAVDAPRARREARTRSCASSTASRAAREARAPTDLELHALFTMTELKRSAT